MAKVSRGGKRGTGGGGGAAGPAITLQQFTPQIQQAVEDLVDSGDIDGSTGGNITFDDFMKMTPDERAAVMLTAMQEDVPDFLSTSSLQRFMYATGMDKAPTLVDDSALDKMKGTSLYRTVHSVYDSANDVNYTSAEIARQLQLSSYTRYSDSGGSAYGRGIYFANNFSGSKAYARGMNDVMIRAKYAPGARVMAYSTAVRGAQQEIRSGSKLGQTLAKADGASQSSLYALAKGYQAVSDQYSGYQIIMDRSALVMSKTTKNPNGISKWN